VIEKTVSIPFNFDLFLQCRKVYWAYNAKNFYSGNIKLGVFSLLCFLIVWGLNDGKDNVGVALTGGYVFYMLAIWMGFFERRLKFFKQSKMKVAHLQTNAAVSTYQFTPDRIIYNDHEQSYSFNWELIKPFEVYKDYLLLSSKENNSLLFMLGRAELGDNDYLAIREILKEKTGDLLMSISDAKKAAGK
jgi:hypothetical protein